MLHKSTSRIQFNLYMFFIGLSTWGDGENSDSWLLEPEDQSVSTKGLQVALRLQARHQGVRKSMGLLSAFC